jgi:hypothetical protein
MTLASINIRLDEDAARIYQNASVEERKKLSLLFSLWLREFETTSLSLSEMMDVISDNAQRRGLTPEILESLLNDE